MSETTAWRSQMRSVSAGVLREAEVDGAGEELPAAVQAASGEKLLGADHSQLFEDFRADHVLAAVAPCKGEIGCAVAAAARKVGDELGVFVVGVRRHVQDAPQLTKRRSARKVSWGVIGSAAQPREIGPASRAPASTKATSQATGRFDPWERRGTRMERPRSREVHRGRTVGPRW